MKKFILISNVDKHQVKHISALASSREISNGFHTSYFTKKTVLSANGFDLQEVLRTQWKSSSPCTCVTWWKSRRQAPPN